MSRPLISFRAIVKNEVASIRRTLESVRPYVDHWVVIDTGSTDGTEDVVREVMSGVPGGLYSGPFVDYSAARNLALDTEPDAAEFTLMLSADEVLEGGEQLRAGLEVRRAAVEQGAYCVEMRIGSAVAWPYTRVLRAGGGWRYFGARHERPVSPAGEISAPLLPGVRVVHSESDPERKIRRLREEDLPHFTRIVEDESVAIEDRAHAIFFLAETHFNLAETCPRLADGTWPAGGPRTSHLMAAMALYWRFAEVAEQPDRAAYEPSKVHYALFMYYTVATAAGLYLDEELLARLLDLAQMAPKMPELSFSIANIAARIDPRQGLYLAIEASKTAAATRGELTNERRDLRVEWAALLLAASCAQRLGQKERAVALARQAIDAGAPPGSVQGL